MATQPPPSRRRNVPCRWRRFTHNPTINLATFPCVQGAPAWRLSKGNLQFVESALDPQTPEARLALARNFRAHKQVDAAIRMFASAGPDAKDERDEYAAELIKSNQLRDAATLWQIDHPNSALPGQLDNPGFENEIDLGQRAFGWRTGERTEGASFALDTQNPAEGKSCLRVDFTGGVGLSPSIIGQMC